MPLDLFKGHSHKNDFEQKRKCSRSPQLLMCMDGLNVTLN